MPEFKTPSGATVDESGNLLSASPQSQAGQSTGTDTNALLNQLIQRAFGSSDIVSSADTGVEKALKEATQATAAAQEAGAQRIERQFGEKISDIREAGTTAMTSARESQRGFGVNRAALKQLSDETEKKVKQYEEMKQEALLANNTQFASQLANLQLKELEFEQQSKQQEFSNLLAVGSFAQGIQQFELEQQREARLQTQTELQNNLAREQFEFNKASTLEEQRNSRIRLNIMERELKIKEAQDTGQLNPDPGFGSLQIQNYVGTNANSALARVEQKAQELGYTQDEQKQETIREYLDMRRVLSKDQVSDDALLERFGLVRQDDGEIGFISGQINEEDVTLPGESTQFVGGLIGEFLGRENKEQGLTQFIGQKITQ